MLREVLQQAARQRDLGTTAKPQALGRAPAEKVDVFWSFRSPYSYVAVSRLRAMNDRPNLDLRPRIVMPMAIRDPGFFDRMGRNWVTYVLQDSAREAEKHGIPFRFPNPDPIVQDLETLEIAQDQPIIRKLVRLGVAACETGHGWAFLDEVSRLIWSGQERWNEGAHIANAAERAGLDYAQLALAADLQADHLDAIVQQNEADHLKLGHWGVPLMAWRGEVFFGQDRIDTLEWRLGTAALNADGAR